MQAPTTGSLDYSMGESMTGEQAAKSVGDSGALRSSCVKLGQRLDAASMGFRDGGHTECSFLSQDILVPSHHWRHG